MYRLLAGTVGYFVVGAIIMKVKFNAMGSDIIPNKAFWFAVPVLIKVGTAVCAQSPGQLIWSHDLLCLHNNTNECVPCLLFMTCCVCQNQCQ